MAWADKKPKLGVIDQPKKLEYIAICFHIGAGNSWTAADDSNLWEVLRASWGSIGVGQGSVGMGKG